jgi:hypothetical protein
VRTLAEGPGRDGTSVAVAGNHPALPTSGRGRSTFHPQRTDSGMEAAVCPARTLRRTSYGRRVHRPTLVRSSVVSVGPR